jgi:hypothetical protein
MTVEGGQVGHPQVKAGRAEGSGQSTTKLNAHRAAEAAVRVRVRVSSIACASLYGGVLLAFLLPFASVSCENESYGAEFWTILVTEKGQAESEALTGWELVRGDEPKITTSGQGDATSEAAQNVRDRVNELGTQARIAFVVISASLLIALMGAVAGYPRWPTVLLAASAVCFAVFLTMGVTFGAGPETHFKSGYTVAAALSSLDGGREVPVNRQTSNSFDQPDAVANPVFVHLGMGPSSRLPVRRSRHGYRAWYGARLSVS